MSFDYIIVQAGGKGSRLGPLTQNKPKALVPIDNLPLLFHLFNKFPDKQFIIIGDYKYDVLVNYLRVFAKVDYKTVSSFSNIGTCSGLKNALSYIPEEKSFMLIWCDLLLSKECKIPDSDNNIIGISKSFPCRWKYENGSFTEESSTTNGVAGLFIFKDKSFLADVPENGEFVRWLKSKNCPFEEYPLIGVDEYGSAESFCKSNKKICRPFNKILLSEDKIYKYPLDAYGESLAQKEKNWYKKISAYSFKNTPAIYGYSPLCIKYIEGKNAYELSEKSIEEKKDVLYSIVSSLKHLHSLESIPADCESFRKAYIEKTFDRLNSIRNLIPFSDRETITVNGRKCRNIFFHRKEIESKIMQYMPEKFSIIHGDCTFSNIILDKHKTPFFIDPRGYFGNTEFFGDEAYDWAKLYYSLFTNYDQFNMKNFSLEFDGDSISLAIQSNKWENLENYFLDLLKNHVTKEQLKLLVAIIWLSLTTYTWENYDSICAAFYNGLYYLEEVLE